MAWVDNPGSVELSKVIIINDSNWWIIIKSKSKNKYSIQKQLNDKSNWEISKSSLEFIQNRSGS